MERPARDMEFGRMSRA